MKLPALETLIFGVFLACILLWGVSKCMAREDLGRRTANIDDREEIEDRPLRRDTIFVSQNPPALPQIAQPSSTPVTTTPAGPAPATYQTPTTTAPNAVKPTTSAPVNTHNPTPTPPPAKPAAAKPAEKTSTLYVTLDGLKVRKKPQLNSPVVATLELYEPVTFLNQKSEKPQEINLGDELVKDYWVKIRTNEGKEGWVFGAGVHYYKMRRKKQAE